MDNGSYRQLGLGGWVEREERKEGGLKKTKHTLR